jgi:hypothetical protein
MKKSKVTKVTFKSEWKNPTSGMIVFYSEIEMENGDKGQIGTKAKDGVKEGDEFEYSMTEDGRGGYKIKKEQSTFSKAYDRASNNVDNQIGQMVGNAITNACMLFANGKIEKDKLEATAQWICEVSMKLKEHFKS